MDPASKRSLHCPDCGSAVAADDVRCGACDSPLSLTSCPECFGPVFLGMRHCPACGAAVDRSPLPDAERTERPRACPRCAKALVPALVGRTRIDECVRCGGIWLDQSAFEALCGDKEQQENVLGHPAPPDLGLVPVARPARMYVPCPACGEIMNRKNFAGCSGIIVDWCRPHGTWFDRRELQGIMEFIKDGGLQKARELRLEELRQAEERLKEREARDALAGIQAMSPLAGLSVEEGDDSLFVHVIRAIVKGLD